MQIILLGTGPFAVPSLRAIQASQHEILCAISRPPRGRRAPDSPVTIAASEVGIETWTPNTVNCDASREKLSAMQADLLLVCDYGEILKSDTLAVTRLGGINLHGSLLPKYRGAAPVQWAVWNGDVETGNTIIQMTPGLDAGPCLGIQRISISGDETAGELEARMAELGAELVTQVVDQLEEGIANPVMQDKSQVTKAPRLSKEHGQIDWKRPAQEIKNQIRALQPWPRAFTNWQRSEGEPVRLIIHRALVKDAHFSTETLPGTVISVESQFLVATGQGALCLLQVQPAGKRAMSAEEFLRGNSIRVGQKLV